MSDSRHILDCFPKGFTGSFLCLGEWPSMTDDLVSKGWTGTIVDHRADVLPASTTSEQIRYIHGPIQVDAHFIQVGPNTWMKALTLRSILDNFQGLYNLLLVNLPSIGKDIACSETVWAFWPKVICINAEGREQEISNLTAAHGYEVKRIERDYMVLQRPDAE